MSDRTRFDLHAGFELSGVSADELFWRYAALGGVLSKATIAAVLTGAVECARREYDRLAQALNEVFLDSGLDTFPVGYRDDVVAPAPSVWPVAGDEVRASAKQVRSEAEAARQRGRAMAMRAADLHATAAELMQASGHLQYARLARQRALTARSRAGRELSQAN